MDFILPAMAISGIALISLVSWSIIYFRRRNHPKPFYISDNTNNDYCNQDMIYEPLLSSSKQSREIEHINKSFANYGSSSLSTSHSSSQQQNLAVSPRHPVPGLLGSLDHPGSSSPIMGFHSPQSSNNLYTPFEFTSVGLGIFAQDDPKTCPSSFNYLTHDFGLVLPGSWSALDKKIDQLQAKADRKFFNSNGKVQTFYKLLFVARHGQGYHNLAIEIYGEKAWDDYWSLLNGDGNIVWGPDPDLTPLGIEQAKRNNIAWKKQIKSKNAPVPDIFFVSPFTRAVDTAKFTWMGIKPKSLTFESSLTQNSNKNSKNTQTDSNSDSLDSQDSTENPSEKDSLSYHSLVVEDLRETIGVHTCDKRATKSEIHAKHTGLLFEPDFSEPDSLWTSDYRETPDEQNVRIKEFLSRLFDGSWRYKNAVLGLQQQNSKPTYLSVDQNPFSGQTMENVHKTVPELLNSKYISVTAHSGTINSILAVTGHRKFDVSPGGMIPVLIKATRYHK